MNKINQTQVLYLLELHYISGLKKNCFTKNFEITIMVSFNGRSLLSVVLLATNANNSVVFAQRPGGVDPGFGVEPPRSCSGDRDCRSNEYCADLVCMPFGSCVKDVDCMNPANTLLQDKKCVGYQYCNNDNLCDRMCGEPCPGGGPQATCQVTGCDTRIACEGANSCAPDYCDDCKGVFFRKNGQVIDECTGFGEEDIDPEFGVEPPLSCSGDRDCESNEYCADLVCMPFGSCLKDVDCMNPANTILQDKKCVGYQYCNNDNMCDRMCGEPCPGGGPATTCQVTGCDTRIACEGAIFCVPDYCDDCKGVFFRKNGQVIDECTGFGEEDIDPEFGVEPPIDPEFGVEPPIDPEFGVEPPIDPEFGVEAPIDPEFGVDPPLGPPQNCMMNSCPVGDGGYCDASGNCLKVGLCTDDTDCFNPYNDPYPVFMCMGEIMCDRGRCVMDCDPSVGVDFGECDKLDNPTTIADYVCNDPDLTELCTFMNGKNAMKKILSDPNGKNTLFAPVNGAFDRLPSNYFTDYTYHVVDGVSTWSFDIDCTAGNNLVTMMNGKDTRTICTKGIPDIQKGPGNVNENLFPKFINIDDVTCNGIVHKISEVLLLKPK